jgi:hypothetical protein
MSRSKRFRRRVTKLGRTDIGSRDLRHVHATLARGSGMDIKVLSVRLGHENVAATMNLSQHIPADRARSVEGVADHIVGEQAVSTAVDRPIGGQLEGPHDQHRCRRSRGARGGSRTHMPLRASVFKTPPYTVPAPGPASAAMVPPVRCER